MADTKTTALSAYTPVLTDLGYGVDDPGGTPISGKFTFAAARTLIEANLVQPIITVAAANTAALTSTGYSLTGSDATSMIDLAGTWNTTGTPTALKLNITNTASNSASKLMDLQTNAVSRFAFYANGNFTFNNTGGSGSLSYTGGNTPAFNVTQSTGLQVVLNPLSLRFNTASGGANPAILTADGADILAQRNTTSAQAFRVYNTWTDASNYEHVALRYNSNIAELGSFAAGTGTLRGLSIGVTSNAVGFMGATPIVRFTTTGTVTGFTAGSGTAANDDSTFTGNSGTKAYTVGDIVLALKNYGLLAAS